MRQNKYIKIKRIMVDGLYGFDKEFNSGLHILVGETNSCGKSLFIKLIDFALGDDGRELKGYQILRKCSFLFAELYVNGELITIKRNVYIIDDKVDIYRNVSIDDIFSKNLTPDETVSYDGYQLMLFKKLTGYDYIQIVSPKNKIEKITFALYTNLFYLNQGVEAGQMFRYPPTWFQKYKKQKILSLFFDTKQIKKSDDEVKTSKLKTELKRAKDELNIKKVFFNENFASDNYFAELDKKNKLELKINKLQKILNDLNNEILSSKEFSDEDVNVLYSLKRELDDVQQKIIDSNLIIKQNVKILNDYKEEIAKTEKNVMAFDIIKKFDINICPECGKKISNEKHNCCILCKEVLDEKDASEKYFEKNIKYIEYLKDSLNDTLEIITIDEKKEEEFVNKKEIINKKINKIEKELNEKTKIKKLPLVRKVSTISSTISMKYQQIEEIDKKLKVLNAFNHEDERIKEVKNEVNRLENQIKQIENDMEDKKREEFLLKKLEENFNSFFNEKNYPYFQSVTIDDGFGVEVTSQNEGTFSVRELQSASNKIIVRLGFFYTLLKTAIEENLNHPKLLYLDSPKDQELEWQRFCESLIEYKNMLDEKENMGQVFITVTEDGKNRILDSYKDLESHVFMRLKNKDNHRLLRLKK